MVIFFPLASAKYTSLSLLLLPLPLPLHAAEIDLRFRRVSIDDR
jgi:hypothetical protein